MRNRIAAIRHAAVMVGGVAWLTVTLAARRQLAAWGFKYHDDRVGEEA